jgi:hypothetical protein
MTTDTIRFLMIGCFIAMYALSMFYLRRRQLSWSAYALWGILALLVPALGPFLVIMARPGRPRRKLMQVRRIVSQR